MGIIYLKFLFGGIMETRYKLQDEFLMMEKAIAYSSVKFTCSCLVVDRLTLILESLSSLIYFEIRSRLNSCPIGYRIFNNLSKQGSVNVEILDAVKNEVNAGVNDVTGDIINLVTPLTAGYNLTYDDETVVHPVSGRTFLSRYHKFSDFFNNFFNIA